MMLWINFFRELVHALTFASNSLQVIYVLLIYIFIFVCCCLFFLAVEQSASPAIFPTNDVIQMVGDEATKTIAKPFVSVAEVSRVPVDVTVDLVDPSAIS